MPTAKELKAQLESKGIFLKGNISKLTLTAKLEGLVVGKKGVRVLGSICAKKSWELLRSELPEREFQSYYDKHSKKEPSEQKKAIRRKLRNLKKQYLLRSSKNG